jgi:DNA-binding winged helix-turn-helix (wHTH) protein
MEIGPYILDVYGNRLMDSGREISLSPLATRFLEMLAREPGAVVDRHRIIDEIWKGDYLTGDPALHRLVSEIRRAVGDNPRNPELIQTVHRRGYRLVTREAPDSHDLSGFRLGDLPHEHEPRAPAASRMGWAKWAAATAIILLLVLAFKLISDEVMALSWVL